MPKLGDYLAARTEHDRIEREQIEDAEAVVRILLGEEDEEAEEND